MSKYTTEVRFICEEKSGLDISANGSDVNNVIANSWNKIFTTNTAFFDEEYRSVLCQKILKHYYLREIGCETVGVWVLWMNTKLEEIMPYYNQLYASAKLEFNPMQNTNVTRNHTRTIDGTTKEDGSRTDNKTNDTVLTSDNTTESSISNTKNATITNNATKKDLYSDTPQGSITGLEKENYLTNARQITNSENNSQGETHNGSEETTASLKEANKNSSTLSGTTSNTGSSNTTEDYIETITGKEGTESYSDLLLKFRETIINIDMMVINEFEELFFGLW